MTMDAGKSGDKREAEQDAEDLRAEVTPPSREDLLGQVEAVRSELLCNVVKKGPPWYATTTGELLDEADVEKGMDRERKDFQQFQVYDEVTTTDFARDQAAGKKPELVEAGWVLVKKPSGAVRCRCVCTSKLWISDGYVCGYADSGRFAFASCIGFAAKLGGSSWGCSCGISTCRFGAR